MMEGELVSFELEDNEKPYSIRHRCYYFSKDVLLFVQDCQYDRMFASLFDQLIRSATSIGANVVEGRAGSSKRDWKKFYIIALKSANETKYWLCLIRDTMKVNTVKVGVLLKEVEEISNIIASIIINSE